MSQSRWPIGIALTTIGNDLSTIVWSHWKRFYACKNMQRLWQKIYLFIELKSLIFSMKYEAKLIFVFRKNVILLTFHFCLFLFASTGISFWSIRFTFLHSPIASSAEMILIDRDTQGHTQVLNNLHNTTTWRNSMSKVADSNNPAYNNAN
jgi:hypothetical protein